MGISKIEQLTSTYLRNEVHFFEFEIEGSKTKFATNIFKVKEIVVYKGKLVDVFSSVDFITGIANIRSVTIPVIDLSMWLKGIKSNSNVLMICDFLNVLVGIKISKPIGIKTIGWDEFVRSDNQKIIGYYKAVDDIIEVLDLEKMVVEAFPFMEESNSMEMEKISTLSIDKIILVADDSKMVQKTLAKILEKMNLKFKIFNNGEELLNFLFKIDPSEIYAVITDLEMPKKSGFEVIKEIKNSEKYSKIPIIVNSTMSGKSNEEMAKSLNADGFISKNKPKEIEYHLKKIIDKNQN
jgi:two-component system chemotaxis response regulator CheV